MKIQEIAEKAGVSTATVSRVFSHHKNIRPEVREKVFAVARKYGWYPRCSSRQRNVVVITPGRSRYPIASYVEMVLTELSAELADRDYRIEILPAENLERLASLPFCGAVAIGVEESSFTDWDSRYAVPLVLVDHVVSRRINNVYSVASDEKNAMLMAVRYLKEHCCRKIGTIVYGESGKGNVDLRIKAVADALKKNGLPDAKNLIRTAWTETCVETIGLLLQSGIDALFCPGGNAGIMAAYALSLYNKRVPDDISLIASERTIYSRYTTPPQTTISQDYPAVVKAIAEVIDDPFNAQKITLIPYHLIERGSVQER